MPGPKAPTAFPRRHGAGSSAVETLFEDDGDAITFLLVDRPPQRRVDRQLVGAVAEGHERSLERATIDSSPHLHQAACPEELRRAGHHHVRPAALAGALLEGRCELLVQTAHRSLLAASGS